MKKQLFALLGLGLLLATVSAYAQTTNVKANIPFNFVVNGKTLPSGEYTIRTVGGINHALSISGPDRKTSMFLANSCASLKGSEKTKLIFSRHGDRYFLSQIWEAGNAAGYELPKSRWEVEMAQDDTVARVVVLAELR